MEDGGAMLQESKITYTSINTDPVPAGLRELASEITTVVIIAQPVNLYSFIAEYLQDQLMARDSNEPPSHRMIRSMVENELTYEAMLKRWGVSTALANYAATIIQAVYRGHRTRLAMPKKTQEDDTVVGPEMLSEELPASAVYWDDTTKAAVCIQRNFRQTAVKRKHEKPPGEPQHRRRPHRPGPGPPNVHQLRRGMPAELTTTFESTAKEASVVADPNTPGQSSSRVEQVSKQQSVAAATQKRREPIPLSGTAESHAVVLPIIESLLWYVVNETRDPVTDPTVVASGGSRPVAAAAANDKRDATAPKLESLFSSPNQDGAAQSRHTFLDDRSPLDGDVSTIFHDGHESIPLVQPPSRAVIIDVESQEFYQAEEYAPSTDNERARLLLKRSSTSIESKNDSRTGAVSLRSEVDMTRSGIEVTRAPHTDAHHRNHHNSWQDAEHLLPSTGNDAHVDIDQDTCDQISDYDKIGNITE